MSIVLCVEIYFVCSLLFHVEKLPEDWTIAGFCYEDKAEVNYLELVFENFNFTVKTAFYMNKSFNFGQLPHLADIGEFNFCSY